MVFTLFLYGKIGEKRAHALVCVSCLEAIVPFGTLLFVFLIDVNHWGDAGRLCTGNRANGNERLW